MVIFQFCGIFRYVQIIVKKLANDEQPAESPDSYLLSDLNSHDRNSSLYVAAELSKNYVEQNPSFTIGDGKLYRKTSKGQEKNVAAGFLNAKLEPESYYSVFQRTFKNDVSNILSPLNLIFTSIGV